MEGAQSFTFVILAEIGLHATFIKEITGDGTLD
jgi:hypothetical protein